MLGLNMEAYEKTRNDSYLQARIKQDVSDGRQAGVRGTPTIFL
jgi:protein-disulfide isomerase